MAQLKFVLLILVSGEMFMTTQCVNIKKLCDADNCILEMRTVPTCDGSNMGLQCLRYLMGYGPCPEGFTSTNSLYQQDRGLNRAEVTLCLFPEIHAEYLKKPECWYSAVQCSKVLGVKDFNTDICKKLHGNVNKCKQLESLPQNCQLLHQKFVELMYRTTPC